MSRRHLLAVGVALGAICAATAAQAQSEIAATAVGELVVTGASLEETTPAELAELGHDLVVVDGQTIRQKSYLDVSSVLQGEVPGLHLAQQAGPFSYVYLSMQGGRTQDVLWTLDGIRINNRLYTTTMPTDTLPASMIERIEVLKGGESLYYGTQAITGSVNVVTRALSEEFGGEITVGGDTNEGWHVDANVRGSSGPHKFLAFVSKDKAEGFSPYTAYQPSATDRERGYDVTTGGLKYGVDLDDDLTLSATYIHTEADLDNQAARLTNFAQNQRNEEIVSAKLDYAPDEGLQFFLKGYFHDWDSHITTINNVVGSPGQPRVVEDKLFWGFKDKGVNAMAKLPVGGVDLVAGYDFQSFSGRDESLLIAPISEDVHAVFGQISTNEDFSDRASLAAGLRYNKTGDTEATVWNVSGRFDVSDAVYLQANGATAFSLPSAEQLFAVDPFSTFGNRELKPERSRSINLSIGGQFAEDRVHWQVTGFARKVKNLITFSDDPTVVPAFIQAQPDYSGEAYVNAGKVKFSGFEGEVSARLTDDLHLSFNYTHAKAKAANGRQIERVPRDFAKANLQWAPQARRFGGSVTAVWTGNVYQTVTGVRYNYGDEVVVDLNGHVWLDDARKQRIIVSLKNALDNDYVTRLNSAVTDSGAPARFNFGYRGLPRTLSLRYSYGF